jgi:hypothetical protein
VRAILTKLALTMHPIFTTFNHPLRVAAQDAIMAAGAGVAVQYLLLYIANRNSGTLTYSFDAISFIMMAAFPAVLAGMNGWMGSDTVRTRIYLMRSWRRTILGTTVALLVPATAAWAVFGIFANMAIDFESWVSIVAIIGFGLANFGIRVHGFYDPAGVSKMLREGRTVDAKVATMRLYAEYGMDYMPH